MSGIIEQERYTCAIGAMQSVVAIPGAVPILHSGPGCADMITGFFERAKGYAGGATAPCTNFSEKEVVFGGIDRLRGIVSNTYKVLDTSLQVVMTGCTAGIVGDDVDSLVREFQDQGRPIVSVETAGFKANNFEAHSMVVNAVIDQYSSRFDREELTRSQKESVNVFASIPWQDPFWKGNLREYKRLLAGIGLKARVFFGPGCGGLGEWEEISRSNFNILISPWYGKPVTDRLEKLYGQPCLWYPHIPVGANSTEDFLRKTLAFALENGAGIDEAAALDFIRAESDAYYEEIENLAAFLLEFRYGLPNHAHIFHDAGYVSGLCKFLLRETGVIPKEQFVTDNTPERFKEGIVQDLASFSGKRDIPLIFEPDAGAAQDRLRKISHPGRGLIIGSGWDRELAKEKGHDFLPAACPSPYRLVLTTNYAGFTGGLRVIEDIYNAVLGTYR